MSRKVVLVMLDAAEADAGPFREEIERDAELTQQVELRFAKREEAAEAIADVEIAVCAVMPPELLARAERLQWVSFWSAGLDGKISPELAARNLKLTNASGVHGPNIAEHVLSMMLMFARQMHLYHRSQLAGEWKRDWGSRSGGGVFELAGQTLGIVGLGRIGEALTKRAKAFDMRVVATKRDVATRYDAEIAPDALYSQHELPRLLAESDHVCIALPYTPDTHGLFDAATLAHMRPTAYLYNIARGKIVDEAALIDALQNNSLAGAGLDVFESEPLPADSPLWSLENTILTPHVSGLTPQYFSRAAALFAANLRRYLHNQSLSNLYDPSRGY